MIEYYHPGYNSLDRNKEPIEIVYGDSCPIDGYLVSRAFKGSYLSHWGKDLDKAKEHYKKHNLKLFGDCGAFSYVKHDVPPVTVEDVIDFYNEIGVHCGASLDHVIPDYDSGYDYFFGGISTPQDYQRRLEITIENGSKFLKECEAQGVDFLPIGAVQGWSPNSYNECVDAFRKMGYKKIAIGGIAKLHFQKILQLLDGIRDVIGDMEIHLLGITQHKVLRKAKLPNITSVDGMGPYKNSMFNRGYSYRSDLYWKQILPNLKNIDQDQLGTILSQDSLNLTDLDSYLDWENTINDEDPSNSIPAREKGLQYTLKNKLWEKCGCVICEKESWRVISPYGEYAPSRGFHNMYQIKKELLDAVRSYS
jgi:hypothetical protein